MNIYFSGIGGGGIGPLAEIALDAGYDVSGSDVADGLMTEKLRQLGIEINIGQDGSFLQECHNKKPIDWVVHTSAILPDSPELLLAKKLGIRISKRDEFLNHIITTNNLKLIAISGTHGKTTTTAMMVWVMLQLKIPISFLVGTTLKFAPSGKFDPASEYFIYECDEFDRNFLHFKPFLSMLTAVDYDHADIYPTQEEYWQAFREFAINSNQVITWADQKSEYFNDLQNTTILNPEIIDSNLKIPGEHNRRNASLIQYGLKKLGINDNTDEIFELFPGAQRRFEKIAENLYSDHGNRPIVIASTLQMAHELSNDIMVVYQPHTNRRQHIYKDEYTDQFELANSIYWLPTSLAREDPNQPVLTPEELTKNITNQSAVHIAKLDNDLWDTIQNARKNNTLVLVIGAGLGDESIDDWVRKRLQSAN